MTDYEKLFELPLEKFKREIECMDGLEKEGALRFAYSRLGKAPEPKTA